MGFQLRFDVASTHRCPGVGDSASLVLVLSEDTALELIAAVAEKVLDRDQNHLRVVVQGEVRLQDETGLSVSPCPWVCCVMRK